MTEVTLPRVEGKAGDYIRWRSRSRVSGGMVTVYDIKGTTPGPHRPPDEVVADALRNDHRFIVVCEVHTRGTHVATLPDAWYALAHPDGFCLPCGAAVTAGAPPIPRQATQTPHQRQRRRSSGMQAPLLVGQPASLPGGVTPKDEATAWQHWALALTRVAPKGAVVAWLGDYRYSISFDDHGCSIDVHVNPKTGAARFTVAGCAEGNGEHPTLEAALAAVGYNSRPA